MVNGQYWSTQVIIIFLFYYSTVNKVITKAVGQYIIAYVEI